MSEERNKEMIDEPHDVRAVLSVVGFRAWVSVHEAVFKVR
jgi:hypothetical protein